MEPNPFTPNFGQVPIHMAGRDLLIDEIVSAYDAVDRGNPARTSILVGSRGTGKTALLTLLGEEASKRGWVTVDVIAGEGMLEDIYEQTIRKGAEFLTEKNARRLKSINVGQVLGVEWDNPQEAQRNWRSRMTDLLERLAQVDVGLLITVDEVDPGLDEMIQLASVYQLLVREGQPVALLMAGLPVKVDALLSSDSVSFLRRAHRQSIGLVTDHEVKDAFRQTVELGNKQIDEKALDVAVEAIGGFPFMMQLVGFRAWQAARNEKKMTADHVNAGINAARFDMQQRVLRTTLDELSDNDLLFLKAMLANPNGSTTDEVKELLDKTSSHVSTYRRRLLNQGVIVMKTRHLMDFAMPGLREYLPEYLEENEM